MSYAGDLRHTVWIQGKSVSPGDRGQESVTWVTKAIVRAMIEPLQGRKLELARQLVATATHEVTMRYLGSLTITDRIVFDGRVFHFGNVRNTKEMNFELILTCIEQSEGAA